MIKVLKRDGREVEFDGQKIIDAVLKAFKEVDGEITDYAITKANNIAKFIEADAELKGEPLAIEDIQDLCEKGLMSCKRKDVAKAYIRYRYSKELLRNGNTTDAAIKELLDGQSDYWTKENSNKNAKLLTTQRDYLAGITSVDIAKRFIFTPEMVKAHEEGVIHIHDMDYMAQNSLTNCELLNLEDMLQNGTVINGVLIEKPHRFITASTIATQIILAVTSSTYGGCSVTLTHLAPFVRDSYNYYYKKYRDRGFDEQESVKFAKEDLKKEVQDGVQTFNYQCNSMTNTNG